MRAQHKTKLTKAISGALLVHALVFSMLFISFANTPDLPESKPIVKATLYQLESQNKAREQTRQKIAGEAEKTAAKQHEQEQLEQKKRQQQAQAAAKKKAEQERLAAEKAAEAARVAEQKRHAEAKAAEQRKLEQQKAQAAKLRAAEQAKAEAERKKAEEQKRLAEQRAHEQALAKEKKKAAEQAAKVAAEKAREAERKIQEERQAAALAELLQQDTEYQRALADRQAEQDMANINDLIRQLVSSNWIRPPAARDGMRVDILVEFLADGTIRTVNIANGSGNTAFDNSAVAAIKSIGRIREIQNLPRAAYEQYYRQLTLSFRPEDLGP